MDKNKSIGLIMSAETEYDVRQLRSRIVVSKMTAEEKQEMLMWCDVRQNELWYNAIP